MTSATQIQNIASAAYIFNLASTSASSQWLIFQVRPAYKYSTPTWGTIVITVSICIILLLSSTHATSLLACHDTIFTTTNTYATLFILLSACYLFHISNTVTLSCASIWYIMMHDRPLHIFWRNVIYHYLEGQMDSNLFYICAVEILCFITCWFNPYYKGDAAEISKNYN